MRYRRHASSRTLSQRACSYPTSSSSFSSSYPYPANYHPFWLSFNAKLCETRGSCESEPDPDHDPGSGPGLGLPLSWGRKHVLCAYANVFPYPWPYQQTQRCLSNARQFKCARAGGRKATALSSLWPRLGPRESCRTTSHKPSSIWHLFIHALHIRIRRDKTL